MPSLDTVQRTAYAKGYNAAIRRFKSGKSIEPERIVYKDMPFAASNSFWNGDMFEDWLSQDVDGEVDKFKKFLRLRDKSIEIQAAEKATKMMKDYLKS